MHIINPGLSVYHPGRFVRITAARGRNVMDALALVQEGEGLYAGVVAEVGQRSQTIPHTRYRGWCICVFAGAD